MIGEITQNDTVSLYNPSKEIRDFTSNVVKKDYEAGDEILNKTWVELNNMSVLDRKDRDQRTFNAFVDEEIDDPNEAWKWIGTRSKARNKAIALHNYITAGYVIPMFMAQNDEDEEDRMFSDIMRDVTEWMINNSDYKQSYVGVSMGMLVNPVTYLGAEYAEVYQKIKEMQEDGTYTTTEIVDETLSGFKAPIYSTEQVLITNAFQPNIQRQRCIVQRRFIEYTEAESIYGKHENFNFVQPGVNTIFNEEDGQFYDIKDDDHSMLVEECIYKNRKEDIEVVFVGGIYMGNVDDIEANPIKHRDNRNAPKYNITPFGYQRVNEHFFFYKSLMNAQYWDNSLLDAQYQMAMNRAFLDTNMPIAITGQDEIDGEVIYPSSVFAFKDKDTKVTPVLPQADLGGMFGAMVKTETSMEESSISNLSSGQLPKGAGQTATAISIANANAKAMLAGVGKVMADSMVQFGGLMADIVCNHLSAPVLDQLSSDSNKLKYRSFILPKKLVGGKEVTKVIKFDDTLLGMLMTDKQIKEKEAKMLEDVGYPNNKSHIYRINPEVFARYKYLTYIEPQTMFPQNEEFMQAKLSDLYKMLRKDPLISAESLVKKLLYANFRSDADDMMAKPNPNEVPVTEDETGAGGESAGTGVEKVLASMGA